jgi:uncharacterized protein YbbC (DUF1343 family)
MTEKVSFGLDNLLNEKTLQEECTGNLAYLGHSAAVNAKLELGLDCMANLFGKRLIKAFGPQHGFVTDVQDNMIETEDTIDPFYQIPIYSLYGETRIPTDEMLSGIDTIIIDLQDIGTRVYTYITTLSLTMEACTKKGIKVVVLDRPNPVGGDIIEGPILEKEWSSFVGHHPIPQRHALTIGEVAQLQKKIHTPDCDLKVIPMKNWKRSFMWKECNRTWINPSPNLSTPDSAIVFCGSVLFEGTNISEGRGSTRALEQLGAPNINAREFLQSVQSQLSEYSIEGVQLRAVSFHPMFQKHKGQTCSGLQIHPTEPHKFLSWRLGALMLKEFYKQTGHPFAWNDEPYEYQYSNLAIDYINGTDTIRHWVEKQGNPEELVKMEQNDWPSYLDLRENILIYR